jgi:hypothetical protein
MAPPSKQAVLTPPTPWYNRGPQVKMPILGARTIEGINDPGFQRFLLAANKRMVRQWMGEVKYMAGDDPAKLAYLYRWFGTSDGQGHFRQWAQKMGSQNGYRPGASAHTAGKASDINYEFNGWCPLCAYHDTPKESFYMIAEPGNEAIGVPTGKIYDRALRIFLPVRAEAADDPHDAKRFARTYYRNHWDWQSPQLNRAPPSATTKLPVDYVYRCYQTLNWAFMFYFNYGFDRLRIVKQDGDNRDTRINNAAHAPAVDGGHVWQNIAADIAKGNLPQTSELLCDPNLVPAEAVGDFEAMQITYPYERKPTNLLRLPLNATKAAAITAAGHEAIVGGAIRAQLVADHKVAASALRFDATSRDPCWGMFNHSYEFILATAGLLTDVKRVRCFGSFVEAQSGDMQHFDYDFSNRPY